MTLTSKFLTFPVAVIMTVFLLTGAGVQPVSAEEPEETASTVPVKNHGAKWRIGYLEGGDFSEFRLSLNATVKGLMNLGWIKEQDLPSPDETTGQALWTFYSEHLASDFLEFVPDGFYSAGWNQETREEKAGALISRLNQNKDLDLMIAMGTLAGIDLSRGDLRIPVIVLAANDPVSSGIVSSSGHPDNAYVHARIDPERYERQIRIFHTLIGFKTLGMIYRDDLAGRSYAAVDKVKTVARERGFTIKTCFLPLPAKSQEDDETRQIQCFKQLLPVVDAIYVTNHQSVNSATVPILAALAKDAEVPTFSQAGLDEVRLGLLMSLSRSGFKYVGNFYAETMAKIFNGATPGELSRIFQDPSKLAMNLSTAEAIGFYPSLDILSSTDEIFR